MRKLLYLIILSLLIGFWPSCARAAISEITAAECIASAVTCTPGTVAVGDLLVAWAYRSGSATAPTKPATWVTISSSGANTNALIVACEVATGTAVTMGSWTNATITGLQVYRGTNAHATADCNYTGTGKNFAVGAASSNTISCPTITLQEQTSSSWVACIVGTRTASNAAAPSGMTASAVTGNPDNAVPSAVMSNTNGVVNSWASASFTGNGTASGYESLVFEIKAPCVDYTCADAFIDMEGGNTVGSTLTSTVMANGTINNSAVFSAWSASNAANLLSVGYHQFSRKCSVTIGSTGTAYPVSHASQSIAFLNSTGGTNTIVDGAPIAGFRDITVAGLIFLGPPNAGASSTIFDLVRMDTVSGNYGIMQLNNGSGGSAPGYALFIESNSMDSSGITVLPAHWYYYSLNDDFPAALSTLYIYDPQNAWALVGSNTLAITADGTDIADVIIGNDEVGTANTTTFFENTLVDVTLGQTILGPGSCTAPTTGGGPAGNSGAAGKAGIGD